MTDTTTTPASGSYARYLARLDADARPAAAVAEDAIRRALDACRSGDAEAVYDEVEFAKFVLITKRCGMAISSSNLHAVLSSPGLSLCAGLSAVSELAWAGRLTGVPTILAEAAIRVASLGSETTNGASTR
jgi:hypothetical protein